MQVEIDSSITDADQAEASLRRRFPGVQIRRCGLQCGSFPYKKKVPFIVLRVDGAGVQLGAKLYEREI